MLKKVESIFNYDIIIAQRFKLSKIILASGVVLSILWAGFFMYKVMNFPHQLNHLEGTANVQTWLLLRRLNPFSLENQPLGATNYGITFSLIVLPFAAIFGNTLLVHRAVTFVFIILSALLGFSTVYNARKSLLLGIICSAFMLVSLGGSTGLGGISAFPSSTGTFFFLVATLIPFLNDYDNRSLFTSVITSLIAFYTKPYFLLAIATTTSFILLYVSVKKGLLFGLFALVTFFLSLLVVKHIFPLYFVVVFWGNVFNSDRSFGHLIAMLRQVAVTLLPLLILVFIILKIDSTKKGSATKTPITPHNFNWDMGFFRQTPNFLLYALGVSVLAYVTILGWHRGNDGGYAYQLIFPLFFCWVFKEIATDHKINFISALLILTNLITWQEVTMNPEYIHENSQREWTELYGYLEGAKSILHPPLIVAEIMTLGFPPMDSGQTIMFYNIRDYPQTLLTDIPYEDIRRDGYAFTNSINRRIKKHRYDLVITVQNKAIFFDYWTLQNNYILVDELEIEMDGYTQTLQIWEPNLK